MVPSTYSYWYLCCVAVAGGVVGVGGGGGGCRVEVGAAPVWVDVGFGGGDTELPLVGMMSFIPMLIIELLSPLASMIACTVTPYWAAMLLSVSPACTTWVTYAGVGVAVGGGVAVAVGGGVSVGIGVSVGMGVTVEVAVAVKVAIRPMVGVAVGGAAPVTSEPSEHPRLPTMRTRISINRGAVLALMVQSSSSQ
jgi:hypothetical protein